MSVVQINRHPSRRQLNQFGFVWLGFVAFFGAVAWFKLGNPGLAKGLWIAAVAVPVIGWLFPGVMRVVFLGMSYLAWPIGMVVSHVVLAVVYYLVFTPIGLVMRLVGRDPMTRTLGSETASYWVERQQDESADHRRYFRQF